MEDERAGVINGQIFSLKALLSKHQDNVLYQFRF